MNADRPPGEGYVPLVMGDPDTTATEILNPDTGRWESYRSMPDRFWRATDCLEQLAGDGAVYNVRTEVLAIDPSNPTDDFVFEAETLDDAVPDALANPGRCAGVEIDGSWGEGGANWGSLGHSVIFEERQIGI